MAPFSFVPEDMLPIDAMGLSGVLPSLLLSLTRLLSPYQLNPFDINPLRDILAEQIDFELLRKKGCIKLFVAATEVASGKLRIFRNKQMSLDAVLASACLPAVHRAVEIDGVAYWDGGFTANPPIFPLLHQCSARDIVVVLLHSHPKPEVPTTADEIFSRLTEIGFSSALFTELQGLALAKREAQQGWFALGRMERRLRNLHVHLVDAPDFMSRLNGLSKLNTQASFIKSLYEEGRRQGEAWLERHFHHLGVVSSFNLAQYLHG